MKTIGQYQLGDITEYKNPQQNSSKLNIAIQKKDYIPYKWDFSQESKVDSTYLNIGKTRFKQKKKLVIIPVEKKKV